MGNQRLKEAMKIRKVRQWQLARKIGISEFTLSRQFRDEMGKDTTEEYLKLIEEIAREG